LGSILAGIDCCFCPTITDRRFEDFLFSGRHVHVHVTAGRRHFSIPYCSPFAGYPGIHAISRSRHPVLELVVKLADFL
jgi:hypothetical protein